MAERGPRHRRNHNNRDFGEVAFDTLTKKQLRNVLLHIAHHNPELLCAYGLTPYEVIHGLFTVADKYVLQSIAPRLFVEGFSHEQSPEDDE